MILCGGGNNGGDGLATARHLHNRGADVTIGLCCNPATYKGDALINWQIVSAMKIPASPFDHSMLIDPPPMVILDAIFGTGLTKPPREPFGSIAKAVNDSGLPVLAVDLPSGLDCDTGVPPGACIRASCTVTFVAEKVGFAHAEAKRFQPANITFDLLPPLDEATRKKIRDKRERHRLQCEIALRAFDGWLEELPTYEAMAAALDQQG